MRSLVLCCLLVAGCLAEHETCQYDESGFEVDRMGPRSDTHDDAEAYAYCQKGEVLAGCKCVTFPGREDDCDGTYIQTNKDGDRCVAKNGAQDSKGVQALAICQHTIMTCTSSYTNMPSISCPPHFKVMSCTMHSSYMQKYLGVKPSKPRVKRSGNTCKTTKGCEKCKVQARCVRSSNFSLKKKN